MEKRKEGEAEVRKDGRSELDGLKDGVSNIALKGWKERKTGKGIERVTEREMSGWKEWIER